MSASEREQTAREVMTSPVRTIEANATVWEAAEALRRAGVSGAPVLDDRGRPIGVFTISDLATYVLSTRGDFKVREFMTPKVVTVDPEAPVSEVIAEMKRRKVHRVFVAGGKGDLQGVITPLDLLGPRLALAVVPKGGPLVKK